MLLVSTGACVIIANFMVQLMTNKMYGLPAEIYNKNNFYQSLNYQKVEGEKNLLTWVGVFKH